MIKYDHLTKDYFNEITPKVLKTNKDFIAGKHRCGDGICFECLLSSCLSKGDISFCSDATREYFKDKVKNNETYLEWTNIKRDIIKKVLDNLGYGDNVKIDLTEGIE